MEKLAKAAVLTKQEPFNIVLDSINELQGDVKKFIRGHEVMEHIRFGGKCPDFVDKYCDKLIREARIPRLPMAI
jgi:hypothetical protein